MIAAIGAATVVVSCSQDEVIETNPGDAIGFRTYATAPGRAAATTTATISEFTVKAYDNAGNLFMEPQVELITEGTESKWTYSPIKYWPNEGTLDFYSYSPSPSEDTPSEGTPSEGIPSFSYANGAASFGEFTVNGDVTKQIDLLYATNFNKRKTSDAILVEFQHALSQIVFAVRLTNENLTIKVDGVSICKVVSKASNFAYPINEDGTAKWTLDESTVADFVAGIESTTLDKNKKEATLTSATGALMLLPQELTAWDPKPENKKPAEQDGAYFLVKCSIKDNKSGIYIWGSASGTKNVAVPVDATWEMGYKYQYTFLFGKGAGYDPEEPDEPVLYPISFNVSVTGFEDGQDGGNEDIDGEVK